MRADVCQFDGAGLLPALPLAAGLVVAAARSDPLLRNAFTSAIHTGRPDPEIAAERLSGARVAAFSCYSWNTRYSLEVARRLRCLDSDVLIVLGGPSVPRRPDRIRTFMDACPAIDVLVLGEGEVPFPALLHAVLAGEPLESVPSLAFRATGGALAEARCSPECSRMITSEHARPIDDAGVILTGRAARIRDFSGLASPYLDGTFDALLAEAAARPYAAVLETNRGCPFSCSFCDWGQAVHSRVHELPLERVHAELEWIATRGVPCLYIVDANFGIRPRDPGITRRLAELYTRYGAPAFCHFHLTKNATGKNLETVATLRAAGIGCQVAISMQDTDARVLAAVRRANIRPERALALRRACNEAGIPTFNELLLGLPEQTAVSVRATLTGAVSPYPGDSFFLYPLRVLENADLASPEEIERHGLMTRAVVTGGGAGIGETEDVVVATRTLPHEEWLRAWRFGQLLGAAYNLRLLHLIVHHIRFTAGEDLAGWIDHLSSELQAASRGSVLAALEDVLDRHGSAILAGEGLALPVAGFGDTPREAHEAFALTALADGARFWLELSEATDHWRPLDAERKELFAYQRFITPGAGDSVVEECFARDWPAWDAARGRVTGGPETTTVRVRRIPPPFVRADADLFAAAWLHAAYAKAAGTTVEVIGAPVRTSTPTDVLGRPFR